MLLWAQFAACALLIIISGYRLSETAERIVKAGRLSEGLMGIFVLAAITSFPEAWTSIASVVKVKAPNLGIGNLIGSVIFNIMILTALDYKFGKRSLLSSVKNYHLSTCAFSLALLSIVLVSLSVKAFGINAKGFFNVGLDSYLILGVYSVSLFFINNITRSEHVEEKEKTRHPVREYLILMTMGAVIIACGFWLASIGKGIVELHGWSEMYFGTIAIAFTTSLPEIVVSLSALSIGSPNMAVGNILGSNLFNILIIPIADILHKTGYILSDVSQAHIYSSVIAILLTIAIFGGIFYKPKKSFARFGIGTIALVIIFIVGNFFLYNLVKG